jgi:hypothetical protein
MGPSVKRLINVVKSEGNAPVLVAGGEK